MARPCLDAAVSKLMRVEALQSSIRSVVGRGVRGVGRDEPSGCECSRRLITINYFFTEL